MNAIRKGIAALLGASRPTAAAPKVLPGPPRPVRSYVSYRALQALKEAPVGKAGLHAFRIQRFADCESNSHLIRMSMIHHLVREGAMQRTERNASFWGRLANLMAWGQGELVPYDGPWTVEAIRSLNARHGPLQIITENLVQPGQGDDTYSRHHAAVLAACLQVDGRWIGMLVDGNDLQSNPAVEVLQAWRDERGDRRPLDALGPPEFEAATQAFGLRRAGGKRDGKRDAKQEPVETFQLGFRFVDLAQLLETALRKAYALAEHAVPEVIIAQDDISNRIWYDSTVLVSKPLLPPLVCDELAAAIRDDPSLVEQINDAG